MKTIGLLLKPLDVLLFRDARPFESGDTGRTQWPTPATFAGLLRTHMMQAAAIDPAKLHGLHAPAPEQRHWFGRLRFRGPWLYVEQPMKVQAWKAQEKREMNIARGPLVSTPADLVRLGKGSNDPVRRLRPLDKLDLPGWAPRCTGMLPMWLASDAARTESAAGWLDECGLKRYLAGDDLQATDVHATDCFAVREDRTGIGIDPDRLTADQDRGLIYSASFWRLLPGVCFYGEFDWPDDAPRVPPIDQMLPAPLVLPWGGERRGVSVEQVTPFDWQSLEPALPNDNLITLLVTPGVFWNGKHRWKPREQGTLRAACVPKPLPISGWDMAGIAENGHQPRPRPTRFAVPAGAVYLWTRGKQNTDEPIARGLRSICDKPQDADNGWGLALSGIWKPCSLHAKE
jgi:CRISPR type III-B/RAMP module-associated protein Cmr3